MKYPTKQKRMVAIFDAYLKRFNKTSATADEVAAWACEKKLYPCPRRGDPERLCELWETLLELAVTS